MFITGAWGLGENVLDGDAAVRARGRAVGTKIARGRVRIVNDDRQLSAFRPGEVLVADTTTPESEGS